LGLAIAQALVRAHHGVLSVESELDHETRFTVDLPLA
jgi:signal transduction histidine kinase